MQFRRLKIFSDKDDEHGKFDDSLNSTQRGWMCIEKTVTGHWPVTA